MRGAACKIISERTVKTKMILSVSHIKKSFADEVVLADVTFHMEDSQKVALIGPNGAGKTTLLKIIAGELAPDSGEVTLAKGKRLGYLAQQQDFEGGRSIYDEVKEIKRPVIDMEERIRFLEQEMRSATGADLESVNDEYAELNRRFEQEDGYAWKSEITGVLKGLGFGEQDFTRPVDTLSGGQKTRLSLGKLLISKPDLILLDEPTNHMDIDSVSWLENYLANYRGAVLVASHDRYFLDRVVNSVVEIESGVSTVFPGNYTSYGEKKAQLRHARQKAWQNQQREIRHQEEVITRLRQFNREKSIKRAESREKALEKMDRLEKPRDADDEMRLELKSGIESGRDVLTVTDLSKSFDGRVLFKDVNFDIRRGERVALIGDNGVGKTTMLRIINGLLPADTGKIMLGAKVHIGYYDQEHHVLSMEKTIFEEIADAFPDLTETQIRNHLAAFLFTGDDVFKRISSLSGGERGRVSLARLMLSEANFLILDEPTNHLDIASREILEEALINYTGTVLYVSHDRYFINRTATRVLELTGKKIIPYLGNYDDYLEKRDELNRIYLTSSEDEAASIAPAGGREDWKLQKEEKARARKKQNDLKRLEDNIHSREQRDAMIDELLSDEAVYTDVDRLIELNNEKESIRAELEGLYAQWEVLAEDVEDGTQT